MSVLITLRGEQLTAPPGPPINVSLLCWWPLVWEDMPSPPPPRVLANDLPATVGRLAGAAGDEKLAKSLIRSGATGGRQNGRAITHNAIRHHMAHICKLND